MAVRALVFDVFGTLVAWRSGVAEAFRASQVPGDPEELADGWRARYAPILLEVNRGGRPWGNFDELHRVTLDDLLTERGLDLPAQEQERLVAAWHRLDPWPDVVQGLTRLKSQHMLCTLSNGNIGLLADMAKHGGLPWDCILSAEVFRAYKPDPATYGGVARVFGVAPSEVMLVAAHQDDLAAARACGLQTAYIERPAEFGAGQLKDVSPCPANTRHARDFLALADQLGS